MNLVNLNQQSTDYQRIEQAIKFLESNYHRQPDLSEVARSVYLSEYHFQRLFKRWAGISPKRFLQYLTIEHAKRVLKESRSLLDATYESGLSSPGRLHDLFVTIEAMTPGEFKNNAHGLTITYGFHSSPFGECLLAATDRGICGLAFAQKENREKALEELKTKWHGARFQEQPQSTKLYAERIFSSRHKKHPTPIRLILKGTNFQIKVWEALLSIPRGCMLSYEDIAKRVGKPSAFRAVGTAVGTNPIAYLIPCHRVIQSTGMIGNYHWGSARKQALLGWEAAH